MAHVALYSPYIPKTKGGGEKYLLSVAEVASKSHKTSLLVPPALVEETRAALPEYESIFGLDLSKVEVRASKIGSSKGPLGTAVESKLYSHIFAMTDGSIFPSFAKKSYFIVQVPWTRKLSLAEKLKLHTWTDVIVYSSFVKDILNRSWQPKSIKVLHPYVDVDEFTPGTKEKIILNVGRFFKHSTSNSKRQDVILKAFKKMVDKGLLTEYTLVLAGNLDPDPDAREFVSNLKRDAFGYHVNIQTDLSYSQLKTLYAKSSFYWHAAGFGVDQNSNPENTEHFGMTTLEAMASGCIPLVVPYGGQKEIVDENKLFWETEDDLMQRMDQLLHEKKVILEEIRSQMLKRSARYSRDNFISETEKLI